MNKQKRHKPEEIVILLPECDAGNLSQQSFCQQKQISVATLHRWRKKYGMMDVADARRLGSYPLHIEKSDNINQHGHQPEPGWLLGICFLSEVVESIVQGGEDNMGIGLAVR